MGQAENENPGPGMGQAENENPGPGMGQAENENPGPGMGQAENENPGPGMGQAENVEGLNIYTCKISSWGDLCFAKVDLIDHCIAFYLLSLISSIDPYRNSG
jgi:hypothetical protein